ncbi:hypothetical protein HDU88_002708 [Geranomyces variabilis]|nr:hypothetical protein HDU88_002708 [Geranomyces variabilis]
MVDAFQPAPGTDDAFVQPVSVFESMDTDPAVTSAGIEDLAALPGTALDIDTVLPMDPNHEQAFQGTHEWTVKNYEHLRRTEERTHGPVFELGGIKWRILLFPSGNRNKEVLSVFLDCVDAYEKQDPDWHHCISFGIGVVNTQNPQYHAFQVATHRFNTAAQDWGFNSLVPLSKLCRGSEETQGHPILQNDEFKIVVWIRGIHDETGVLWHKFENWDSRQKTGFVGLKNQGATCYMNSVLQSLYFTNYFRKATFEIPTENEEPSKSIVLALQRIFYNLQFNPEAVSTTELTKSFGWDALDSFAQHDVQEFNRVLQDNLESKMKGTRAEGAISRLFVGKMKSYIRCLNVDYESSRMEDFYDIQLNVKGCKTLKESFDEYVAVETLDGDNKYMAEDHGLQEAKKGVIFTQFPPILHLQLKRFEYDFYRDVMVKINDRHEYPSEIVLDGYLADEADKSVPQKYHLHGVLVHSGDLHGGHYCAFLRPTADNKWYKFDDDRVTPATKKEVFDENFGGEVVSIGGRQGIKIKRFTNAYMLVYIRDTDRDQVLAPVTTSDIPAHLLAKLEEERIQVEAETKEREEAHLFTTIKVLRDEDTAQHHGFDMWNFDSANPAATFKVAKADKFAKFRSHLTQQLGLSRDKFRLWTLNGRQNRTIRPDSIVGDDYDSLTIDEVLLRAKSELRYYLEEVDAPNLLRLAANGVHNSDDDRTRMSPHDTRPTLIWLKFYDPVTQAMQFVGRISIDDREQKIGDIVPLLLERARLPPGTPLRLFEEIKPGMIDQLKLKSTFVAAELSDGDIICYQRDLSPTELAALGESAIPDVPSYFEALRNRVSVAFKEKGHDREQESAVSLQLSKKMNYGAITSQLARAIGADADKIRLLSFVLNGLPMTRGYPIKYSATWTLEMAFGARGIAAVDGAVGDVGTVIYEILGIQVRELESKRYLKVYWVDKKNKEQGPFDILVSKVGRVADLTAEINEKIRAGEIKLEDDTQPTQAPAAPAPVNNSPPRKLRLFELSRDSRIGKTFTEGDYLDTIKDGADLYIEEVLPTEISQPLIQVFHFSKDPIRGHGVPFVMTVIPAETFAEMRPRLQARLGMNEKEMQKAKFLLVEARTSRTRPIEEDDIISELPRTEEWSIGVDHVDKSARGGRLGGFEKAIKIFMRSNQHGPQITSVESPSSHPDPTTRTAKRDTGTKRDSKLDGMAAMFDELLRTLPKPVEAVNEKPAKAGVGAPPEPVPLRLEKPSDMEEQRHLKASISQASSLGASSSIDITDFFAREASVASAKNDEPQKEEELTAPPPPEVEPAEAHQPVKYRPATPAPLIIVSDASASPTIDSSLQSTPRSHLAPAASLSDAFSSSFAAAAETSRSNLSVHVPQDGGSEDTPSPDAALPPKGRKTRPSLRKLLRHRSRGSMASPATPPPASPDPRDGDGGGRFRALTELHIVNNWIAHIPPGALRGLPNLVVLDLSQNLLTDLPAELAELVALREIYARENRLAGVPAEFGDCAELRVCDLGRNRITDLSPAVFSKMASLTTLDLSHNLLRILPSSIGLLAASLRCLYVHGNPFDASFLTFAAPFLAAMGRIDDLSPPSACTSPTTPDGSSMELSQLEQQVASTTASTPRTARRRIQSLPTSSGSLRSGSWTSAHLRRLESIFADKGSGAVMGPSASGSMRTVVEPADANCEGLFGGPTSIQDIYTEDPAEADEGVAPSSAVSSRRGSLPQQTSSPQSSSDALADGDPNAPPFGLKMRQKGSRRRPDLRCIPQMVGPHDSFSSHQQPTASPSYGPRSSSLQAIPSMPSGTGGSERSPQKPRFSLFGGSRSSLRGANGNGAAAAASASGSPTRTNSGGSGDSERQTQHLRRLLNCLRDAYDLDPRVRAPGSVVDILDRANGDADGGESESGSVSDEGRSAARMEKKQKSPDRRQKVAVEILSTERTYVRQLEALMEVYVRPIEEKLLLNPQELNAIFANVKSILLFHSEVLLPDLEKRCAEPDQPLGGAFLAGAPFLRMYSSYYNNFDAANRLVSQLESTSSSPAAANVSMSSSTPASSAQPFGGSKASAKRFREFVASAKQHARHTQASLQSFLILPVQRLPRYKLLVDELFECTSPQHPDYSELKRAREEVRRRVAECNEKKREWEARESGLTVLERVLPRNWSTGVDAFSHVRPGRRFVRDGTLTVLKCVEFAGAASGHARVDALQACAGKKERFRQRVIGHLIETRFGGGGEKEETATSSSGSGLTGEESAGGAALAELRLAGISGRLFHFFLFTDVLCWCRAKAGADGRHDLIQGMGIGLGDGVGLTEVEGGVDKKMAVRQGVLRVRSRESILYLIGEWEQMVGWRDACNGDSVQ